MKPRGGQCVHPGNSIQHESGKTSGKTIVDLQLQCVLLLLLLHITNLVDAIDIPNPHCYQSLHLREVILCTGDMQR